MLWLQTDREQKLNMQHIKSTKKSNEVYIMPQIMKTTWFFCYSNIYTTCPAINLNSIPLMVDFFSSFFLEVIGCGNHSGNDEQNPNVK